MIFHLWTHDANKLLPNIQAMDVEEAFVAPTFDPNRPPCLVVVTTSQEIAEKLLALGAIEFQVDHLVPEERLVIEQGPIVMRLSEDDDEQPEETPGE